MTVPAVQHPYQHLLCVILILAILVVVKWYIAVFFFFFPCISLMTNNDVSFFHGLIVHL